VSNAITTFYVGVYGKEATDFSIQAEFIDPTAEPSIFAAMVNPKDGSKTKVSFLDVLQFIGGLILEML